MSFFFLKSNDGNNATIGDFATFWYTIFWDKKPGVGAVWHAFSDYLKEMTKFVGRRVEPSVFLGTWMKLQYSWTFLVRGSVTPFA